jgi:predicted ATP-grasp superfamily ATP-dependent carboligase
MADILVAGLSARALAGSARSAGLSPLAADLFHDLDLEEAAERSARIEGDLSHGLEWERLIHALERLSEGRNPIGIVYGAGFEDRTQLLAMLAERWRLLGNSSRTVERAKDPGRLAAACKKLGIPRPEWSDRPRADWLQKRVGGSGGIHIAVQADDYSPNPSAQQREERIRFYWQERVEGEAVGALVLANREKAIVLGFSAQWRDPAPDIPFRYGGAVRPAGLPSSVAAELAEAAIAISREFRLVGLNSIDFLVAAGGSWTLIEINPRPGATLDIFRTANGSLLPLHIEACRGRLPGAPPAYNTAAAAMVVYARRDILELPVLAWPDWTADRQRPGPVSAGAPLCTVLAEAGTATAARRLVEERRDLMLDAFGAG